MAVFNLSWSEIKYLDGQQLPNLPCVTLIKPFEGNSAVLFNVYLESRLSKLAETFPAIKGKVGCLKILDIFLRRQS